MTARQQHSNRRSDRRALSPGGLYLTKAQHDMLTSIGINLPLHHIYSAINRYGTTTDMTTV